MVYAVTVCPSVCPTVCHKSGVLIISKDMQMNMSVNMSITIFYCQQTGSLTIKKAVKDRVIKWKINMQLWDSLILARTTIWQKIISWEMQSQESIFQHQICPMTWAGLMLPKYTAMQLHIRYERIVMWQLSRSRSRLLRKIKRNQYCDFWSKCDSSPIPYHLRGTGDWCRSQNGFTHLLVWSCRVWSRLYLHKSDHAECKGVSSTPNIWAKKSNQNQHRIVYMKNWIQLESTGKPQSSHHYERTVETSSRRPTVSCNNGIIVFHCHFDFLYRDSLWDQYDRDRPLRLHSFVTNLHYKIFKAKLNYVHR